MASVDEGDNSPTSPGEQNPTQLINNIVTDVSETLKGTISTYNNRHIIIGKFEFETLMLNNSNVTAHFFLVYLKTI